MEASQSHTQQASNASPNDNHLEVCHPQEQGEEPQSQTHTEATVTKEKKRKAPDQRSSRWEDYTVVEVEVGDPPVLKKKAKCKRCGTLIAADSSRNGTTGLKNHTEVCKRKHEGSGGQARLSFQPVPGDGNGSGALSSWKFNQKESRLALCEMIILDELPFRFVEREGFRKFVARVCPEFRIPSRQTIREDAVKLFAEKKGDLKGYFTKKGMGRVSITNDCWTAINNTNFICVTAHFIGKDWNLHKKIIAFRKICSHKGEDIGESIIEVLNEWDLKNILCCTMDNATSNDGAARYIRDILNIWKTDVLGGKYLHMRCAAHIINLVVKDGLEEIGISVTRVREAVKWIKASPKRSDEFTKCCKAFNIDCEKSLSLDVPTRWNSTYLMLESAEPFEQAFKFWGTMNPSYVNYMMQKKFNNEPLGPPQDEDWVNVRKMIEYLKTFYDLTLLFSGTSYVTAHLFFKEMCDLFEIISELEKSQDVEIAAMATKMKYKVGKYWLEADDLNPKLNKILYMAALLDPRQKMKHVEMCLKKVYGVARGIELVTIVRCSMDELFELYKKQVTPTLPLRATSSASHSHATSSAGHRQRHPRSKRPRGSCASLTRHSVGQQEADDISEMTIYFSEKQHVEDMGTENEVDDDDVIDSFDILQWWLNNGVRYPILSEMARDILAIPISTVASESAFSMGGRVLDQFRSSLSPKMVEALICSSDWLRSSSLFMNDEEDVSETEQEKEFGIVMTSLGFREVSAAASAPAASCTGATGSRA